MDDLKGKFMSNKKYRNLAIVTILLIAFVVIGLYLPMRQRRNPVISVDLYDAEPKFHYSAELICKMDPDGRQIIYEWGGTSRFPEFLGKGQDGFHAAIKKIMELPRGAILRVVPNLWDTPTSPDGSQMELAYLFEEDEMSALVKIGNKRKTHFVFSNWLYPGVLHPVIEEWIQQHRAIKPVYVRQYCEEP